MVIYLALRVRKRLREAGRNRRIEEYEDEDEEGGKK